MHNHRPFGAALALALAVFSLSPCMSVKPEVPKPGRAPAAQAAPAPAQGNLQHMLEDRLWTLESATDATGRRIDADGRLAVQPLASSRMACEPPAMRGDAAIAELLEQLLRAESTPGPTLRWAGGQVQNLNSAPKWPSARDDGRSV